MNNMNGLANLGHRVQHRGSLNGEVIFGYGTNASDRRLKTNIRRVPDQQYYDRIGGMQGLAWLHCSGRREAE